MCLILCKVTNQHSGSMRTCHNDIISISLQTTISSRPQQIEEVD